MSETAPIKPPRKSLWRPDWLRLGVWTLCIGFCAAVWAGVVLLVARLYGA